MKSPADVARISRLSPGTAIHSKGKQRVQEILRVATNVLAFEGYSNFTMRGIASKCGMTLRNLQYYFQSKNDLFQAVVDRRIEEDIESARSVVETPGLSPEERFLAFVDLSILENTSPLVRGFQFELWALATRDRFASQCRDRATTTYCEFIYKLIKPLAAKQSSIVLRNKSAIVLAMLQGAPLITGEGVNLKFNTRRLKEELKREALNFVRTNRS